MHLCNFTFIIPHKNIPSLLQRCIDSIPQREDVHIVVVDDNSDSCQVDFSHFPGLNNPFVEVIFTKEGYGAGYARNVGLKQVQSKWVLFADADDFFYTRIECLFG
ncbi:glycosyltransferase family 2 protein [Bacteroides ovatus]|nr:glycosyltransferase family 2 protein [Bacteroides ovatus]